MIKGLDYEKLISSKIVRDNMDLDNIDDVAVATLIENKYFMRDENMKMFELVMNQTDNEALKKEISEYLEYEMYMYDVLTGKNDGDEIGNWSYADDSGYIVAIEDGNYLLCGEYYTLVLAPKKEGGQIVVELWGETGGELWETLTMTEHYES